MGVRAVIVRCAASALVIRSLPVVETGTDTGARMIRDQTATAHGFSMDGDWLYVDAPQGRGWCSARYLEEPAPGEMFMPSPGWPRVPHGLAEIRALYGEPGRAICSAGRARLPAPLKLSWSDERVTVFACHKLLEDVFSSFFHEVLARGYWTALEDFGGCYNPRTITASQKVSIHSWGAGFDINTLSNPLGKPPKMDISVVLIGTDHGLTWGGTWARPDGMHFQRATGY